HGQRVGRIAEPLAPIGTGAPCRCFENETSSRLRCDRRVFAVVGAQGVGATFVVEQHERGEVGKVEASIEDHVGLETRVGEEDTSLELWQGSPVPRHSSCSSVSPSAVGHYVAPPRTVRSNCERESSPRARRWLASCASGGARYVARHPDGG